MDYDPSRDALYRPHLATTAFVEGTWPPLVALAVEACRLAYVKAEHGPGPLRQLQDAWARVGFTEVQPFQGSAFVDAQGFAAWRPEDRTGVVAFRGTEPEKLADLGTNLSILPVKAPGCPGRVHRGFALAYESLHEQVTAWLSRGSISELLVCGHSLGGAMAMVCAQRLRPSLLVTLGCPRVGNEEFVQALEGLPAERIVDCCDVVPDLPPPLFGYAHPTAFRYIAADGQVHATPAPGFVAGDRAMGREVYAARYAWRQGAVSVRDLADHAPANYVRAFF